jgi:HlyD family secretion protein
VAPYVLDVEEQNRTVEVEVAIPQDWLARGLKPGTSADVEIVVERKTGVSRLPANVLVDGKRALVVERGAAGELRAVERELEIGIDNWRYAEIKGGLEPGARVVAGADGGFHVKAGSRVEVRGTLDESSK